MGRTIFWSLAAEKKAISDIFFGRSGRFMKAKQVKPNDDAVKRFSMALDVECRRKKE